MMTVVPTVAMGVMVSTVMRMRRMWVGVASSASPPGVTQHLVTHRQTYRHETDRLSTEC